MCVDGNNTGAMRDWAMSTKVDTSRSRWRATTISGLYVERNALRADLVLRAEEWRWSSLWRRCHGTAEERSLLATWPIDLPADWLERVNETDDEQELESLRQSVQRGRPFGQPQWQKEIAKRLGLESAYRPTGRPRKVGRNQNAAPG
jgi:hypothetical protein